MRTNSLCRCLPPTSPLRFPMPVLPRLTGGRLRQRAVEWCPKELAAVLDVVGVVRAPSKAPVCDGGVGLRAEQILGKEGVLKIRLRGEGLAVTDW
jgi:hypothetical protein